MLSVRNIPYTTPELIPVLYQTYAQAYCQLAASILIVYEHVALLEQEIEYMWHWKTTGITVLFLVNRYILLLSAALGWLSVFDWTDALVIMSGLDLFDLSECHHLSCEWLFDLQYALTIILVFIIAWFSALRVYAVSCRRRWPGVLTLATAVITIPVQLFGDIRSSRAYVTYIGHIPICTKSTFFSDALNTRFFCAVIYAVRVCAIFSDLVVLCCTWFFAGVALHPIELGGRFIRLILRQGTIYFISLLILNVVQIIIETSLGTQTVNAYYTATFTGPISSILIGRFMLALRAVDQSVISDMSDDLSGTGAYPSESTTAPVELTTINFGERTSSTAV